MRWVSWLLAFEIFGQRFAQDAAEVRRILSPLNLVIDQPPARFGILNYCFDAGPIEVVAGRALNAGLTARFLFELFKCQAVEIPRRVQRRVFISVVVKPRIVRATVAFVVGDAFILTMAKNGFHGFPTLSVSMAWVAAMNCAAT